MQLFDGAMGTMLQAKGLKRGESADEWNLTQPETVRDIHRQYLDAGAHILTTNTFGANRRRLEESSYSVEEVITAGVKLAQEAIELFLTDAASAGQPVSKKQVALDIGPIGRALPFEETYNLFKEQIIVGVVAGVDLILIETMLDLAEAKAAILAAKDHSDLPIYCTMTFQENSRTFDGTDIATFVSVVEALGVTALGANCSYGPEHLQGVVDKLVTYASTPIIIQANAGLPEDQAGTLSYAMTPTDYACEMKKMAAKGVTILGGCCGTTPAFIKAMKQSLST